MAQALTYDTVIATRNRVDALRICIPLLIEQNRKPAQIIVVDSSDDPAPIRAAVEDSRGAAEAVGIAIKYVESGPGLPYQRNVGLTHTTADVVFFPDDDSLVLPGCMEAILMVYERDSDGIVGGVCAAEAVDAPQKVLDAARAQYEMTLFDRIAKPVAALRYRVEEALVPNPFTTCSHMLMDRCPDPQWIGENNTVRVEWMTGFRMSFRSEAIKARGFDDALEGYALFEDLDASYQIMDQNLALIGAREAQIYHHKAPAKRAGGYKLGVMQILNRAYALAKIAPDDPKIRRQMRRYCRYKIMQYTAASRSEFGRDRMNGAKMAFILYPELFETSPAELRDRYLALFADCMAAA